uniref:Uncharacterized protein n=1 Tax=Mus musculus TaxID=10090 RepID=O88607_MOUSE|nr:unknown [Mus musculus]
MSEMTVRSRSILFSARKQNGGCSGGTFLPANASLLLGYVIAGATLSGSVALGFGGCGDPSSLLKMSGQQTKEPQSTIQSQAVHFSMELQKELSLLLTNPGVTLRTLATPNSLASVARELTLGTDNGPGLGCILFVCFCFSRQSFSV